MEDAIREAKRNCFSQDSPGWLSFVTARSLAESAAFLAEPVANLRHSTGRESAFLLFTEALRCALNAHLARLGVVPTTRLIPELLEALEKSAGRQVVDGIDKDAVEEMRAGMAEPFQPGVLSAELMVKKSDAARLVVAGLLEALESDAATTSRLLVRRGARIIGIPALIVALIGGLGFGVWLRFQPPNLALNKPVTISSHLPGYPGEKGAVDGVTSSLGFHTLEEQSPWLQIDLQAIRRVKRVKVYNRSDGMGDRAVPLVIEGSEDGKQFRELVRRDKDFSVWDAKFTPSNIRYLRLVAPRLTFLHLNEVEVY